MLQAVLCKLLDKGVIGGDPFISVLVPVSFTGLQLSENLPIRKREGIKLTKSRQVPNQWEENVGRQGGGAYEIGSFSSMRFNEVIIIKEEQRENNTIAVQR